MKNMIKNITKADHAKGLSETINNISGNLLYICSGIALHHTDTFPHPATLFSDLEQQLRGLVDTHYEVR
jgi:hypothetical protein